MHPTESRLSPGISACIPLVLSAIFMASPAVPLAQSSDAFGLGIEIRHERPSVFWQSQAGTSYHVLTRDSVAAGDWERSATIVADSEIASWLDIQATPEARFYRIQKGEAALVTPVRIIHSAAAAPLLLATLTNSPYAQVRPFVENLASSGQLRFPLPFPDLEPFEEIIVPDVQVYFDDANQSITFSGSTILLDQPVELLLVAYWGPEGANPSFTLGIKFSGFDLSMLNEGFAASELAQLDFQNSVIILAQDPHTLDPLRLPGRAFSFYEGTVIDVERGVNMFRNLDLSPLPIINGLQLLGIPETRLALQGFAGVDPNVFFNGIRSTDPALLHLHSDLGRHSLSGLPSWISATGRRLDLSLLTLGNLGDAGLRAGFRAASEPEGPLLDVVLSDQFKVKLGTEELTFETATDLNSLDETSTTTIVGTTTSVLEQPLGIHWLTLSNLSVELVLTDGAVGEVTLSATYLAEGKEGPASIKVEDGESGTVEISLSSEELTGAEIAGFLGTHLGLSLSTNDVPEALVLKEPTITIAAGAENSFTATGKIPVLGPVESEIIITVVKSTEEPEVIVSIKRPSLKLSDLIPSVAGTPIGDLEIPLGGFASAEEEQVIPASEFEPPARKFFEGVFGTPDFNLAVQTGVTFETALPLTAFSPLVLQSLGLKPSDRILVKGSVDTTLGILSSSPGLTLDALYLVGEIPPGPLPGLPSALQPVSVLGRRLILDYSGGALNARVETEVSAMLDGAARTFAFATSLTTGSTEDSVELTGMLAGTWSSPYGVDWLELDEVQLQLVYSDGGTSASLSGVMDIAGNEVLASIDLITIDGQPSATIRAEVGTLSLNDLITWMDQRFGASPFGDQVPDGLLEVNDLVVEIETAPQPQLTVSGSTTLLDAVTANVLMTVVMHEGLPEPILSFGLEDFPLSSLAYQFKDTLAGDLKFPASGFTFSRIQLSIPSDELSESARDFFNNIHGPDFTLRTEAGVNIAAKLPLSLLPSGALRILGMNSQDSLVLEGTVGISFGMLSGNVSLDVTHLDLTAALPNARPLLLPQWMNSDPSVQRTIAINYARLSGEDDSLALRVTDRVGITIDGARRMFVLSTAISPGGTLSFTGELEGSWDRPFGVEWLTLDAVMLSLSTDGTNSAASLRSSFPLGGKTIDLGIGVEGTSSSRTVELVGTVNQLSIEDVIELVQRQVDRPLFPGSPPADFATLDDVTITIRLGNKRSFSIGATGSLAGLTAELLWSIETQAGQDPHILLGIQPAEWSLSDAFPALSNPIVDSLELPTPTLVFSSSERRKQPQEVQEEEKRFYGKVYGPGDWELRVPSGLGLLGGIPLDAIPPDGALRKVMDILGMEGNNLIIEGSLGGALELVTGGGGGGADLLRDLSLRVNLPDMRPSGSPPWFRSGRLAIEITGAPSVMIVGEVTVEIEGDILTFFVASGIGDGPSLNLTGGLMSEEGWVSPLDVEWLTINKVTVTMGITATGSVELGFAGDVLVGEKDISVAGLLAVSPAGIPTNLIMEGASTEGLALSDLVAMQARMAATLNPGAPRIPIGQLPNMAVRNLLFKVVPKDDDNLGVQRGLDLAGDFYMELQKDGPLEHIAGGHMKVGDGEISAEATLISAEVGSVSWEDPYFDLLLSLQQQHLMVGGLLASEFVSGNLDLSVTREEMSFDMAANLFGQYEARLRSKTEFNFATPDFPIEAGMLQEFLSDATAEAKARFSAVADEGKAAIADAQQLVNQVQSLKSSKEGNLLTTLQTLREELDLARQAMDAAYGVRATALSAMYSARTARDNAWNLYAATPNYQVALKAARYSNYLTWRSIYNARYASYQIAHNAYLVAKTAYEAIPSIEANPVVVALRAEINELANQLEDRRRQLAQVTQSFGAIIAAIQESRLAVESASFDSTLGTLISTRTASMSITLSFAGERRTAVATWDFTRTVPQNLRPFLDQILSSQGIL